MSVEQRARYSQTEIDALGAKGQAFKNPDGHFSFPCADRQDVENAVRAVGRAPATLRPAIRRFIMGRAKALGCTSCIPDTWAPGGSLRAAEGDLEQRLKTQEMLKGARELRTYDDPPELRTASDGSLALVGHASRFGNWYDIGNPDRGGFRERVAPGAFRRTLSESPDVSLLLGHGNAGSGLPIARTTAGNLTLSEDELGLAVVASPLDRDDPDVQLLEAKMRNRLVSGMSFAFICAQDEWNQDQTERTVKVASLHRGDVSVVIHGANDLAEADLVTRSIATEEPTWRPSATQRAREQLMLLQRSQGRGQANGSVDGSLASPIAAYRARIDALRRGRS